MHLYTVATQAFLQVWGSLRLVPISLLTGGALIDAVLWSSVQTMASSADHGSMSSALTMSNTGSILAPSIPLSSVIEVSSKEQTSEEL